MTPNTHSDPGATLTEVVLPGVVEPDGLVIDHRPVPIPTKGQVLVQMLATGVSFAENSMRRNRYPGQPKFPFVPGYDLVGTVTAAGPDVDPTLVGQRVAAVTKTGGWSTHLLIDARHVVPVPEIIDPADIEAVLLTGITAWQMLHRAAGVRRGQTILVHGASGGVGMILVQLAREAGIHVIGTGSPRTHDTLRELGVQPLDYRDPNLVDRVRDLAPDGIDAVFDNIDTSSFKRSFSQLNRGGALIAYGTASKQDDTNNMNLMFLGIVSRFGMWSLLPNGRRATFYNFWGGKIIRPKRFRDRLASDLAQVLQMVADGTVTTRIAARFPLTETSKALSLAGSGTVSGKIVLTP
jgi:NADPH:quinone reductase-like Zn-dependent oxidoreductase